MNVLLVVAEDRAICESLRASLPERDLLLFEPSLPQGLRRLISLRPDAVVVDDGPQLGREAIRRLREAAPTVPVIAISSRGDAETLANFLLAGARACVAKPFSCDDLRRAVDTVSRPAEPEELRAVRPSEAPAAPGTKSHLTQHQTAMRWLNRLASLIKDPDRIGQSLADAVGDVFDAARYAVLLESGGAVRVAASSGMMAPCLLYTSV